MKRNFVGMATFAVALASIASLSISYAGQGSRAGVRGNDVPDHPLITAPISAADVAPFKDASTLWLSDALAAQGAQARGKKTKFNETTFIHTSVFVSAFSDSLVRHKEWSAARGIGQIVGGNPDEVRPLTGQEYAALLYLFNTRLTGELKGELVADQNGIRGKVPLESFGLREKEYRRDVSALGSEFGVWVRNSR